MRPPHVTRDMERISIYESHSATKLIREKLHPVWYHLALIRCVKSSDFHVDGVFEDVRGDRDEVLIRCCDCLHGVVAYKAKAFFHGAVTLNEEGHAAVFELIHEDHMSGVWPLFKFDWHGGADNKRKVARLGACMVGVT